MKKIKLLAILFAGMVLLSDCKKSETVSKSAASSSKYNPLRKNWVEGENADPWIMTYNGNYYMIYNKDWNRITVRVAPSILGLNDAPEQILYNPTDPATLQPAGIRHGVGGGSWLYRDAGTGKWYLYGWGDDWDVNHAHPFVAESTTGPLGPYTWKATFTSPNDGLDGYGYCSSPMLINGQLYLTQTDNGKIYLAKLSNPWTINTSAPSDPSGWNLISEPNTASGSWECANDRCINEGGTVVVKGDYAYILFMAGGYESPNYCVGMIRALKTANLLAKTSWNYKVKVYEKDPTKSVYGPSLNWFKSPNGAEDWVVGHVAYSSINHAPRFLQYKKVTWDAANPANPSFGTPYSKEEFPTPLLPAGDPGYAPSNIYEAESAAKTNCVNQSSATASAGWYVKEINASGDKLTFSVNVPTIPGAGTYLLKIYYTNTSASTAVQKLSVNALPAEIDLNYPTTGGNAGSFPDDRYIVAGIKLNQGANSLAFKWAAGTVNIDKIQLDVNKTMNGVGAASRSAGLLNVFTFKESTSEIWTKAYSGGIWGAWAKAGTHPTTTSLTGAPQAVSRNVPKIDVVSLGRNGELWSTWWDVNWNTWYSLGKPSVGICMVGASTASYASNKLDVFVLGGDRQIWTKRFTDGGAWSAWSSTPVSHTKFISAPAVTFRNTDTLELFATGADGGVWWNSWAVAGLPKSWRYLGLVPGGATSAPAAAAYNSTHMDVFVRGGYGQIWRKSWIPIFGWGPTWIQVPNTGMAASTVSPGATAQKLTSTYNIFAQSGTTVYTNQYTTAWSGWTTLSAP